MKRWLKRRVLHLRLASIRWLFLEGEWGGGGKQIKKGCGHVDCGLGAVVYIDLHPRAIKQFNLCCSMWKSSCFMFNIAKELDRHKAGQTEVRVCVCVCVCTHASFHRGQMHFRDVIESCY